MNFMSIIALVSGLVPIATEIGKLWESSAGFTKIAELVLSSGVLKDLEAAGAQMFPMADKAIQKVLAALHLGYPASTKWIQTALNAAELADYISFGAPLVVDGMFGPKTFAAVVVLQAKLGVKPTGAVADAEYKALNSLLAGKMP